MQEKAFAIIDQSHEQMLKLWSDLVNMDSGTTYKAGVDAVADRIEAELKAIGFNVGGKIGIARCDENLCVAIYMGIGVLNLNEMCVGLAHRSMASDE